MAVITIAFLVMGVGCPCNREPYVKALDLNWTFFTGLEPTPELPKKLGSMRLDNLTDKPLWYVVEDLPSPYQIKGGLTGSLKPWDIGYLKFSTEAPLDEEDIAGLELPIKIYMDDPGLGGQPVQTVSPRYFGTLRPYAMLNDTEVVSNLLGGETLAQRVAMQIKGLPRLEFRFNSNPLLTAYIPEPEVEGIGRVRDAEDIDVNLTFKINFRKQGPLFPCGDGPNGYTVCPDVAAALPEGETWLILSHIFDADVPLADPANYYQYGFVFDADGDPDNNYVPLAQFANDFYQGTDLWYSVEYSPAGGWNLIVTDARNNTFSSVASAARAIISGNTIVLAVPYSEFSAETVWFRLTSFRHSGDYGQNPPYDWSSDYHPRLDELTKARLN